MATEGKEEKVKGAKEEGGRAAGSKERWKVGQDLRSNGLSFTGDVLAKEISADCGMVNRPSFPSIL